MTKILCIPDGHVEPGQDLSRWRYLGKYIVDERPDIIVQLGDFLSMKSLSHWDQNKKKLMEGRRYREDIEAGRIAISLMNAPLRELQRKQRANKKRQYIPDIYWVEGNHEIWLPKYLETHPELEGELNVWDDLQISQRLDGNVQWVPFHDYVVLDNIAFCHAPLDGAGRPTSGKYAIYRALELFHTSVVFAHLHRYEHTCAHKHGPGTNDVQVLACGCFFEHELEYAPGAAQNNYASITMLHTNGEGQFGFEAVTLEQLRTKYG